MLARGRLSGEGPALAVRIALAIPLGECSVRLVLADDASALACASTSERFPWSGSWRAEVEALVGEEEMPVEVERESLEELGLAQAQLIQGVRPITRAELTERLSSARHTLVI